MDFSADICCPSCSTRFSLSAALSDLEHVIHCTMNETGMNSPSFEIALPGTTEMTEIDLASSFMQRVLAASTIQPAKDETVESVPGNDHEDVERKSGQSENSAVQQPTVATKSEIERILADPGVVTVADVERIDEIRVDHLGRLIKSNIVMNVGGTFEDALYSSYFEFRRGLKTAMFNIIENVLERVVQFCPGDRVTETELHRLVQSRSVAESIFGKVLSRTAFTVLMIETVRILGDKAFG